MQTGAKYIFLVVGLFSWSLLKAQSKDYYYEHQTRYGAFRHYSSGGSKLVSPLMFLGALKVGHLLPLADMQSYFVFYKDFKSGYAKALLMKAGGSHTEVRL